MNPSSLDYTFSHPEGNQQNDMERATLTLMQNHLFPSFTLG